jgi:hypothetical protein
VGAATHANIMHAGGYGSVEAYLIVAVAALLGVGMGYARSCGVATPSSARLRWGAVAKCSAQRQCEYGRAGPVRT